MTTDQPRPPADVDPTRPSAARMYDYALGGKDHYEVDRTFVHQALEVWPQGVWVARQNRAYLTRAVRYLAEEAGIRQFIDHGSGLPTQHNVHQIAQRYAPDSRVVYIDHDPEVLAHGRALLANNDATIVITADMANPEQILGNPEVARLIDFHQPVGVLYLSVLHSLPDDADPWGAVTRTMAAVPSGSYLALSDVVSDDDQAITEVTGTVHRYWGYVRRPEQVARCFAGLQPVEPGLVDVAAWRLDLGPAVLPLPGSPEPTARHPAWSDDAGDQHTGKKLWEHGGVGRKP